MLTGRCGTLFIFSGRNLGYDVYKGVMGEEMFKQKIEEFEKVLIHNVFTAFYFLVFFFEVCKREKNCNKTGCQNTLVAGPSPPNSSPSPLPQPPPPPQKKKRSRDLKGPVLLHCLFPSLCHRLESLMTSNWHITPLN